MRKSTFIPSLLLSLLLPLAANLAVADDAIDASGPITVTMVNPDQFAEIRQNRNYGDVRDGAWLDQLQKHVVKSAGKRLPAGQTLDVRITDIKRAGDFEPWRGPNFTDVRIVKDIYSPRISLNYTLRSVDGSIISEGDKSLRDPAFLSRSPRLGDDRLRYEKRLLDDWIASLLPHTTS